MRVKKDYIFVFTIILWLNACSPQAADPANRPAPATIRVGLSPILSYLKTPLASCADQDPAYEVLLLEKNSQNWIREPVDLILTLQQPVPNTTYTYQIDEVRVAIIASRDFPLDELQRDQLEAIYHQEAPQPELLGLPQDAPLSVWGFEKNSQMSQLFLEQNRIPATLPDQGYLAASPITMVEDIGAAQLAVGYTLSAAVTDQVKPLQISGLPQTDPFAVIVSAKLAPSPQQEALIRCLQISLEN